MLFKVYRRLALLKLAFAAPCFLWHAVLRFDHVTAIFAKDAFSGGVAFRHGRVLSKLALGVDFFFDAGNHFFVLRRGEPLFLQQIFLEAVNAVALTPELMHLFGDVSRGVVDGVALHTHQFGFDQRRPFAAMGTLNGFIGGVIDLAGIRAVNNHAGHAVANGAIGQVFHIDLIFRGRGVSPEIAFDDQHQAQLAHGGKVDAFIAHAGGLSAVADPGKAGQLFALQARAERYAGHDRQQVAQHGDGRDHVALLDIAIVRSAVFAFRGRPGLRHVLHHDVARVKAADKLRALVADHGRKPVVGAKRVSGSAGAGFLPQAKIDAAHNLALLVKIFQRHFHAAVHHHPAVDFQVLLLGEIFRFANRRHRRVEFALDLIMYLGAVGDFADLKFRLFQTPVWNAVPVDTDSGGFGGADIAGTSIGRRSISSVAVRSRGFDVRFRTGVFLGLGFGGHTTLTV